MHFVRNGYNYDRREASLSSGLKCVGKSLTQQSQKEEADINTIVRRFGITGQVPQSVRAPQFQDFMDVFDFQTAMNAINEATSSFMEMDSKTRARFMNDPQQFVEFCSNKDNLEEMRKLGLAVPEVIIEEPKPLKVEVVTGEIINK